MADNGMTRLISETASLIDGLDQVADDAAGPVVPASRRELILGGAEICGPI